MAADVCFSIYVFEMKCPFVARVGACGGAARRCTGERRGPLGLAQPHRESAPPSCAACSISAS